VASPLDQVTVRADRPAAGQARPPAKETLGSQVLYKEYVRRSNAIEKMTHSSFDDFKLLGALGAIFAWKPLSVYLTGAAVDRLVLFAGFAALSTILFIIAARDLLKQALIGFGLRELRAVERALAERTRHPNVFDGVAEFGKWRKDTFAYPLAHFHILVALVVIGLPIFVLCREGAAGYAFAYAAWAVALAIAHVVVARRATRVSDGP
jgi:hypothetical protein